MYLPRPGGFNFLPPSMMAYMIMGGGALGLTGGLVSVGRFLE
jgi:hypothetical protein